MLLFFLVSAWHHDLVLASLGLLGWPGHGEKDRAMLDIMLECQHSFRQRTEDNELLYRTLPSPGEHSTHTFYVMQTTFTIPSVQLAGCSLLLLAREIVGTAAGAGAPAAAACASAGAAGGTAAGAGFAAAAGTGTSH